MLSTRSLTELIRAMQITNDQAAAGAVFAAAASRLRDLASKLMASELVTGSFDASDLVQEVYLRKAMRLRARSPIADREHFFSMMVRGMRQILTDRGRRRRAAKRSGHTERRSPSVVAPDEQLLLLGRLKDRLRDLDPDACRILILKVEHGLSWEEISAHTGVSVSRCRLEYGHAIHWLRKRLR